MTNRTISRQLRAFVILIVTLVSCWVSSNQVLAQVKDTASSAGPSPWQSLTNPRNVYSCDVNLLTDGTLVDHGFRFTPDISGSYVNGAWTANAALPSGYSPGSMARAVLPDGRLIYEGGEVNNGVLDFTNLGAIYNPVANSWTPVAPPSGWSTIGGAPSVVLANGTFMMGRDDENGSREQALLNAATLTWTPTGSGKADANQEEGWTLLPDGSVLVIDSNPAANPTLSERYNPATGTWTSAGSTTVRLSDSEEMGPQVLRPDGTVIVFGALSSGVDHTAIYHSASGTWTAGPDLPTINGQTYTMNDAPAALLPSGNVLFAASPSPGHGQTMPTHFFEFDGTNIIQVADPPNAASLSNTNLQMLELPTGQIFVTACGFTGLPQIYSPSGNPNPVWAPAISSVPSTLAAGTTYSIGGTQFNGLSQGAMYGDEGQQYTNYPLVRITNSATKHVFYCRTHDHSTMGVATGITPVSTHFDVPMSIESGPSTLVVVANGIPSSPVTVMVEPAGSSSLPSILPGGVVPVGGTATTIQSGEWVSIYGTNLASTTTTWTGVFTTSLGGTSVTIDGMPAYLSYVSSTQINLQSPSDAATGSVSVVVTTANGVATSSVSLAQFAPSFFLLDGKHVAGIILRTDGSGVYGGGLYDIIGPTGSSLGYPTVAAKAGDVIELFGTGFGPTNPAVPPGQSFSGAAATTNPVRLLIDNASVIPSFAGLSGAGLYQINLTVPPALGTGDVTLVATVGGAQTSTGVAISLQ